jgi:hypothetical protein
MHKLLVIFPLVLLLSCGQKANNRTEVSRPASAKEVDNEANPIKLVAVDGTHSAAVNYYNPETSYRASYKLNIEVKNGEVSKINFPSGSYLNDMHINPEQLDEEGNATLYDDERREFDVEIVD